ncbi:MAG: hypothetical protein P9L92_11565 [Candidatus Electryonea clarkiae]|nr:hypothetical protein [Candidatus Electryonea clarkiae]MDP8285623.1 hypothetical protein [Candidatus Electryonea clarkiae]
MPEKVFNGRFLRSPIYDKVVISPSSWLLTFIVFFLTFIIQVIISMFEGTLLPSAEIEKPLIDHLTILVGGTLLIPALFYQASRFYKDTSKVFGDLETNGILDIPNRTKYGKIVSLKYSIFANIEVVAIVFLFTIIQLGGQNADVNYVHLIDGNPTVCGWYYAVIFAIIAYHLIILIIDTIFFARFVRNICNKSVLVPKLLFPDEKCGLENLIRLGQRIVMIYSIFGFYFLIIFLNWEDTFSLETLFGDPELLMMIFGFFLLSPIILLMYFKPIKVLLNRFKDDAVKETFSKYGINTLDLKSSDFVGRIQTLKNQGFFTIYEGLQKTDSRLFEFKLFANVYTMLLLPLLSPFVVSLLSELFKQKVLK